MINLGKMKVYRIFSQKYQIYVDLLVENEHNVHFVKTKGIKSRIRLHNMVWSIYEGR